MKSLVSTVMLVALLSQPVSAQVVAKDEPRQTELPPLPPPPPLPGLQKVDKVKLRQAAHLPTVSVEASAGFGSATGLNMAGEDFELREEVAALEKSLKGDGSDAVRHLRLAELYDKLNDTKRSKAACEQALKLCREKVKAQPENGRLLGELAMALFLRANKDEEAEKLARRAVQLSPRDWYCKIVLGRVITDQAGELLYGEDSDLTHFLQRMATNKLANEVLEKARKQLDEAMTYCNQAIELAPENPETWKQRLGSRVTYDWYRAGVAVAQGKQVDAISLSFNAESCADLNKLTQLCPDDYKIHFIALIAELMPFVLKHENKRSEGMDSLLGAMPKNERQSVERKLRRLDELTKNEDPKVAAGAAEVLGRVYFVFIKQEAQKFTAENAEASFRRAIELNPNRGQAWDLLTAFCAITSQNEKGLEVALARLKHKDNAHNRLLAAKAFEVLRQYDKAEEQVRLGLKKEPQDVPCMLGLAALLLKHDDAKHLEEAGTSLDAIEKLLQESTPDRLRNEYLATRGVSLALAGKPDQARQILREVLKRDSGNYRAQEALSALGE